MKINYYNFVVALNIFSLFFFFVWLFFIQSNTYFPLDREVFYFFNNAYSHNKMLATFVAIINNRAFDLVAISSMGALYYSEYRKLDIAGKRKLIIVGFVMVCTAVIVNQIGQNIPIERPSPTLTFENANRVGEISGIHTKDASKDSFPGDHGLMLLIFACFVWRYISRRAFGIAMAIMLVFSLPRVMAGAHWLSDIVVGSVCLTLITMSWFLLTPLSDYCVNWLNKRLPPIPFLESKYKN